jgi:hypothetical protein
VRWYRDRATLRWIAARYLPWMLALNLAWEAAHVRLYTLWQEADAAYIAFSIAHCTLGDVLIGAAALALALVLGRAGPLPQWRWSRIAALTAIVGAGYTLFSEWMNITLLRSWTYSKAMPTLDIAGFEIGLTPLAQWLVLPPLALYLGRAALSPSGRGA